VDTLTHALLGLSISSFREHPKIQRPTIILAAVLGSELPDLDLLPGLFNPQAQLVYHRGFSHSLLGLAVTAGLLTLALGELDPRVSRTRLLTWTGLALLLHVLFDSLTTYGTWALYPFVTRPLALDILYSFDLPILVILGTGCFFYLARARKNALRTAFILVLMYAAGRWGYHARVDHILSGQQFPVYSLVPGDPLGRLVLIVDRGDYYQVGSLNISGQIRKLVKVDKNLHHPLALAVNQQPVIDSFLGTARYPYVEVAREGELWRIKYSDLRLWPHESFKAVVYLDDENRVVKIKLGPRN